MKKSLFLLGIALAAFLGSCTDDSISDGKKVIENPVQPGDEIVFGSSVSGEEGTRTVYGERTQTGIPVYWESGDQVAIFCLQSSQPADHLVNYTVEPQSEDRTHSASVTKVDPEAAGLQWGSEPEHRFYAFYPASAVKGTDEEDQTGMITANIPVNQQPDSWEEGELNGVKTYFGLPNMNYAYMYAHTKVNKDTMEVGTPINLEFKNLVTVLDITVQGPVDGGSPITVSNINVNAVDGQNVILTGDFTCNIRGAQDNSDEVTAECTAAGDLQEVRNRISIPCYNRKTGEFITLNPGEQLNVKAYIIPDGEESHIIHPQQLEISVAITNGAAKRKILKTADVTPYKVNRVILPHLTSGGTNYWMSDLDPRIYVTELSLPGSKQSVLSTAYTGENVPDLYYQTTEIGQQFDDGVRAFILPVQRQVSWGSSNLEVVIEGAGSWGTDINVMPLQDAFDIINKKLQMSNQNGGNEFAFVLLTWVSGGSLLGDAKDWIEQVASDVQTWQTTYNIYGEEITPSTTLGDVRGHIIVKANTNLNQQMDELPANARYPMLFSEWRSAEPVENLPLLWGTSNYNEAPVKMYWYAQEMTNVGGNDGTVAQKKQYIQDVFEKSVELYQNNSAHNTWFMNDLGGYYGDGSQSGEDRVTKLTTDMNNLGIQLLQERTENAGLGLVFMNFADKQAGSGVQYRSDWLIQTVIDNNFKFQLRMAGSADDGTRTYDATYNNGGNAISWDN